MNEIKQNEVMKMKKFEVGKTYSTRSICDSECIFSFEVLKRTAKQITLKHHNEVFKRGVYIYDGAEHCKPFGSYSMCPIIEA
jgi:hypothetical protein